MTIATITVPYLDGTLAATYDSSDKWMSETLTLARLLNGLLTIHALGIDPDHDDPVSVLMAAVKERLGASVHWVDRPHQGTDHNLLH